MIYCSHWVSIWAKSGFFGVTFIAVGRRTKRWESLWCRLKALIFLLPASIQAQLIVKGIRRNETATIETVRRTPLRHGCFWVDLVQLSFVKQNVLQRSVSKLLNESPHDRQNRRNRRYMFRKTIAMKSYYNFWLTLAITRRVEIYIFQTFEARTRSNQANITGLGTIDLWPEFYIRKAVFKASGTRFLGREAALLATKSRWVFVPRAKF